MFQTICFVALGLLLIVGVLLLSGCGGSSESNAAPKPEWPNSTVLAPREDHPAHVIVDADSAYFVTGATMAGQNDGTNNVKRIAFKDGALSVLVTGGKQIPEPVLAQDERYVYWADGENILRVPKAGGGSEVVVPKAGTPVDIVVDQTQIYWILRGGRNAPPQSLLHAKKEPNSPPQPLTTPYYGAHGLTLDHDELYWVTPAGIYKIATTGGAETAVFTAPKDGTTALLAVDDEAVYFAAMNATDQPVLMKLSKKGGVPIQLAPSIDWTYPLLVDPTSAYFFERAQGEGSFGPLALWKVPKAGGPLIALDKGPAGSPNFMSQDAARIYITTTDKVLALDKSPK